MSRAALQGSSFEALDDFASTGRPCIMPSKGIPADLTGAGYGLLDPLFGRRCSCLAVRSSGRRSPPQKLCRLVRSGVLVSLFAVAGDVLRPKSFAGLFGAAPSVALATLTLAFLKHCGSYVSTEGRSMIIGAVALAVYSFLVCQLLMRLRFPR